MEGRYQVAGWPGLQAQSSSSLTATPPWATRAARLESWMLHLPYAETDLIQTESRSSRNTRYRATERDRTEKNIWHGGVFTSTLHRLQFLLHRTVQKSLLAADAAGPVSVGTCASRHAPVLLRRTSPWGCGHALGHGVRVIGYGSTVDDEDCLLLNHSCG